MADTIADISVTSDTWTDVYSATGIAVGSAIYIHNKGSSTIYIQEAPTSPSNTLKDGVPLADINSGGAYSAFVGVGSSGVWIKSEEYTCKVSVQEA